MADRQASSRAAGVKKDGGNSSPRRQPDRNPLYAAADPPASGRCPTARGPSVGSAARISAPRQHVPSLDMAITQRPLVVRRDLIRIFGEDRLVAVIRTSRPDLARAAAHAMSEAG